MKKNLVIFCCVILGNLGLWADTITVDKVAHYSTTLASPTTYAATNSVFTYYGFPTTNYPNAGGAMMTSYGISSAGELGKFPPVQVSFDLTGTSCELMIDPYDHVNNVWSKAWFTVSDGVTTTAYTNVPDMGPGHSPYYVPIIFGTSGTHHILLSVKGTFTGVNVSNGNTVSSRTLSKPNLLIVEGDSYTEGYNPTIFVYGYNSFWFDGWVWQLARLVPNTIAVPSGIGGTGFVASNGGSSPTYGQRVVADICTLYSNAVASGKYNQIFITASGTINDLGANTNVLYTAATDVYTTLKNACPQAHIFFVGNWLGTGGRTSPQSDDVANDIALCNAALTTGIPYFSPIRANVRNAGNYSVFFTAGTDSVHPGAAGYGIMANWVNTNLAYSYGTNWDSNSKLGSGVLKYNLIVNNGSGSGSYTNGQVVTITATNIYGSYFTNWSGPAGIMANPNLSSTTLVMPATNTSVTANLVVIPTASNINVTDYGAVGDAIRFTVQTTSNSPMVSVVGTNRFSSADIGKVIEVFHAGPWLRFNNDPTKYFVVTNQDTICLITNVTDGTNLWGSIPQGWTKQTDCIVGSNNRLAFQAAIDFAQFNISATNRNVTINIPDGNYLIVGPKVLNPSYVMSLFDNDISLTVTSGGITFNGASTNAVLMGCGAGMNHVFNDTTVYGSYGHFNPLRGTLFQCRGPVVNNQYPLIFKNLVFDGGLTDGLQNYNYFTLIEATGEGWDTSHDVLLDINPDWSNTQMHQLKVFTNCVFQHWRGEMLKNVTSNPGGTNTFIEIANCLFQDGNASANNLYFGQYIHGCTFKDLVKVAEYYQGNATLPSVFENNVWSNIVGSAYSIVGSSINVNPPSFTFRNNVFYGAANRNQIHFAPAENVFIVSNNFVGQAFGVVFSGVGVQPSDGTASIISNIVVACNQFNYSAGPIMMDGYPVSNVLISNNTSAAAGSVHFVGGASNWKTNILLYRNSSPAAINARDITQGSFFYDDPSNNFGPIRDDTGVYFIYNGNNGANPVSYGDGRFHAVQDTAHPFVLDDLQASLIPRGALLTITNMDSATATIYGSRKTYNSTGSSPRVLLPPGQSRSYLWTNGFWRVINPSVNPPTGL